MDMNKRYIKSPSFVFRIIDDEALLVPIVKTSDEVDCIYTLSPVGAKIWEKIDGKATVEQIKCAISDEYEADDKIIEKDAIDFLSQLEEIGSIKEKK